MNDPTPVIAPLGAQEVHAFLRSRRSIRQYRAEMPAQDKLDRILASAAMAPSAHNRQPWRYFVICDAGLKAALAQAMGESLAADRRRDGDAEAAIKVDVERSFTRISSAPVVILAALTLAEMDNYPNEERRRAEYLMAVQSTAMATQNLLLAAHAEGLGACWMCAPLFCTDVAQRVLALPPDWDPQGLLTLGYPASPGRLKPRKPQAAFVTFAGPMREPETKR
jgi:coenzyme F420-0:L-glutamate ligase/coenzyme F420-1:gamma-L-glutamate ligase